MTTRRPPSHRSASGFDLGAASASRTRSPRSRADAGRSATCCLHHGTEAPFCGGLLGNKEDGVYCCRLCGLPLVSGQDQVRKRHRLAELLGALRRGACAAPCATSATAWSRVETRCARCDSHQGHVFPDGPPPDGRPLLHQLGLACIRPRRSPPPDPTATRRSICPRARQSPRFTAECCRAFSRGWMSFLCFRLLSARTIRRRVPCGMITSSM